MKKSYNNSSNFSKNNIKKPASNNADFINNSAKNSAKNLSSQINQNNSKIVNRPDIPSTRIIEKKGF
jgi:hypothetical protein